MTYGAVKVEICIHKNKHIKSFFLNFSDPYNKRINVSQKSENQRHLDVETAQSKLVIMQMSAPFIELFICYLAGRFVSFADKSNFYSINESDVFCWVAT